MSKQKLKAQNFINLNKEKKSKLTFNKSGNYTVFFQNLSGEFVFEIKAEKINLNIFGLYIGKKTDDFRVKTKQFHFAPNSTSSLLIKGVFNDQSRFIYEGLIRLEKEAQKSHAYQKNQNLILSANVFVDSRPFLEILANDVFCTHGSTTGKPNPDQLYYFYTRGLNKKQATKLLADGFINEVFDKMKKLTVNYD